MTLRVQNVGCDAIPVCFPTITYEQQCHFYKAIFYAEGGLLYIYFMH